MRSYDYGLLALRQCFEWLGLEMNEEKVALVAESLFTFPASDSFGIGNRKM